MADVLADPTTVDELSRGDPQHVGKDSFATYREATIAAAGRERQGVRQGARPPRRAPSPPRMPRAGPHAGRNPSCGKYRRSLPQLGPGFVIERQARVLWQRVFFDHGKDGLGDVGLGSTPGTSGRIGAQAKWTIVTDGGQMWQPYMRANFSADWGGKATTTFSGTDGVPLLDHGQRLELGGGFTTRINANLSFFANADYQFAVGNSGGGKRDGIKGSAGLRYTW